jgi:hypothetical protein
MTPHNVRPVLQEIPALHITTDATEAEAMASMRLLGTLNARMLGVPRCSGLTPWETHPDGTSCCTSSRAPSR